MGKFIFKRFCIFLCACIVCDANCEYGARVDYLVGLEHSSDSFDQKNVRKYSGIEKFENLQMEKKSQSEFQIKLQRELLSLQDEIKKINARLDEIKKINARLDEERKDVSLQTDSCLLRQKSSVDDAGLISDIDSPTGSAVSSADLLQYASKSDVKLISEKVLFLEQKLVGAREIIKKLCSDSLSLKRVVSKFIVQLYLFNASKKV